MYEQRADRSDGNAGLDPRDQHRKKKKAMYMYVYAFGESNVIFSLLSELVSIALLSSSVGNP